MTWQVKVHKLVEKEDFKKIDPHQKAIIIKQIKKKLSADPENYGEPLLGELKKYRKLVVNDYRVIYRTIKDKVLVLVVKVGIRRDGQVYEEMLHRLKKI